MSDDVFRWVIAVGVLLACVASLMEAIVLTAIYFAARKAQGSAKEAQAKLMPLVHRVEGFVTTANGFVATAGKLLEENRPRISGITADALAIAESAREHADRIGELI